jgi:hypothetical protein
MSCLRMISSSLAIGIPAATWPAAAVAKFRTFSRKPGADRVGICSTGGGSAVTADGAGHARAEPQKKSSTPQTLQRLVAGSHVHNKFMAAYQ